MRLLIVPLAILCVSTVPDSAGAKNKRRCGKKVAGQLLIKGNRLFLRQRFKAALARYNRAYGCYPSPKLFLNLGRTHAKLGNLVEAARYYERFLSESGTPRGGKLHDTAEVELASIEPNLGRLIIHGEPLGAEVFLNGEAIGSFPLDAVRVMPRIHNILVQKPGYEPFRGTVTVSAGETAEVAAALLPPGMAAPLPPMPEPQAIPDTPNKIVTEIDEPEEDGLLSKWWFWTAVGVVVVGAASATAVVVTSGRDPEPMSEFRSERIR